MAADFKKRVEDWQKYKAIHKYDFIASKVCVTSYPLRNIWWFLLQPVDKRLKREKEEAESMEAYLEKLKADYKKKHGIK